MARPKGAKNVTSGTAKENVLAVFTRLEGTAGMAKWARKHPTEFYKLYGRLLPIEGPGTVGEHILTITHKSE